MKSTATTSLSLSLTGLVLMAACSSDVTPEKSSSPPLKPSATSKELRAQPVDTVAPTVQSPKTTSGDAKRKETIPEDASTAEVQELPRSKPSDTSRTPCKSTLEAPLPATVHLPADCPSVTLSTPGPVVIESLRIDSGVTLLLGPRTSLWITKELEARGQSSKPVLLGPMTPKDRWGGIIGSAGSQVTLEHVVIRRAGGEQQAAVTIRADSRINAKHLHIEDPDQVGLYLDKRAKQPSQLAHVEIRGASRADLHTWAAMAPSLGEGMRLKRAFIGSGVMAGALTLGPHTRWELGRISLRRHASDTLPSLRVEAGTELHFEAKGGFDIHQGTLTMVGKADAPIHLSPITEGTRWHGIHFLKDAGAFVLEHLTIHSVKGEGRSAILVEGAVKGRIQDVSFEKIIGSGLRHPCGDGVQTARLTIDAGRAIRTPSAHRCRKAARQQHTKKTTKTP